MPERRMSRPVRGAIGPSSARTGVAVNRLARMTAPTIDDLTDI
jgi:hypothetical protein